MRRNGVDRFFHSDWLGSTRTLTDGSGGLDPNTGGASVPYRKRFDAYGLQSNFAGTDSPDAVVQQYAGAWGYQRDAAELGLDYLHQRYYDPALGRFITRDPIRWAGGLNLYGYTGNNPVNSVDPSGLSGLDIDYEDGEIPLTRGHLLAQQTATFAGDPMFRPGSPQRCSYAGFVSFVPYVGAVKDVISGVTGRDPISGVRLGRFDRVLAAAPVLPHLVPWSQLSGALKGGSSGTTEGAERLFRLMSEEEANGVRNNGYLSASIGNVLGDATRVFEPAHLEEMLGYEPFRSEVEKYTHLAELFVKPGWRATPEEGGARILKDIFEWAHHVDASALRRFQVGRATVKKIR